MKELKNPSDVEQYRFAQLKRDGFYVAVSKNDAGLVQYVSKNGNPLRLMHLPVHGGLVVNMPRNALLICELWKPGEPASYISSGIASSDPDMILECHGVANGVNHMAPLCEAATFARRCSINFVPYYDRRNSPLSMGRWYGLEDVDLKAHDCEGLVLKNRQYGDEVKWKPKHVRDLAIVDATAGKGKFEGLIGALVCATRDGTVVANVSGMTDSVRAALTVAHENGQLVGRIAEVEFQYVASRGKLRHPVFLRLRDDKDVADESVE